ncbi:MAG: hypothetical protein ACJA2O_002430 [Candidatus Azotimanducaceae bacterium]|jgi:hypothetical protein
MLFFANLDEDFIDKERVTISLVFSTQSGGTFLSEFIAPQSN